MSCSYGVRWRAFRVLCTLALALLACAVAVLAVGGPARSDQMVATWYGPGFEGASTASGEPFDPGDYTAAHRTLPFGTKLIVTYGGRSVVVRINDRGPYAAGRDIDLSQAAAEYLGITSVGVATVSATTADPSTPTGPYGGKTAAAPTQPPAPAPEQQAPAQPTETVTTPDASQGADASQYATGGRRASEAQYADADQYTARDQYEADRSAVTQAPAETQPVAPPPVPDPSTLEAPPAELATAGSTVERSIVLAFAAPPEDYSGPEPGSEVPAEKTSREPVPGVDVLPDTGGVSLLALVGGASLVAFGVVLRLRR